MQNRANRTIPERHGSLQSRYFYPTKKPQWLDGLKCLSSKRTPLHSHGNLRLRQSTTAEIEDCCNHSITGRPHFEICRRLMTTPPINAMFNKVKNLYAKKKKNHSKYSLNKENELYAISSLQDSTIHSVTRHVACYCDLSFKRWP